MAAMTHTPRQARISRQTSETRIELTLVLDGAGKAEIATGVGFFDHMADQLARHGMFDISLSAEGDTHIDDHHTVEDCAIALGQALDKALGDRAGIRRWGHAVAPMDEALVEVAIDLSGRAQLHFDVMFPRARIGEFDTELVREFCAALAREGKMALHVMLRHGQNAHHIAESVFKALARALRAATEIDPRAGGRIPSTKGRLTDS